MQVVQIYTHIICFIHITDMEYASNSEYLLALFKLSE